jgi:hypothetical protein
MQLCYVDESGTPEVPGNGRHFVLAGLAIPIWQWRDIDVRINAIATKYGLGGVELHTAWMLRGYIEQRQIPGFVNMNWQERRRAVAVKRATYILELQKTRNSKLLNQTKKTYKQSSEYMHLTQEERVEFIVEIASFINGLQTATLFAECIDKFHFDPVRARQSVDEQAFEQIISRFEQYLRRSSFDSHTRGIVVHDNNQTVARKHTDLMRRFHAQGTLWTNIQRIIETPMFVDSKLTSMVQLADLCSYSIRRYLDHSESHLFNLVFPRGDRVGNKVVGMRHFTDRNCTCLICTNH